MQTKVNISPNGKIHIRFTQDTKENKYEQEISPLQRVKPYFSNLVGMHDMIKVIEEIYAVHLINMYRKEHNLHAEDQGLHMVFTGNPGTGKTTVARIVATLFKDLNILPKGQIIECDRASLVGEYIGETAQKTNRMIDQAIGGVLFIDEAYALARGGEKDFGREAIDHLVKRMEDDRKKFVVIIAGYPNEMKYFLSINPGLSSRFSHHITFSNYSIDELFCICEKMFTQQDYMLTKSASIYLFNYIRKEMLRGDKHFSNGRFARNFVERTIRKHAVRVINEPYKTEKILTEIQRSDMI